MITILALATEPFTQQIVVPYTISTEAKNLSASICRLADTTMLLRCFVGSDFTIYTTDFGILNGLISGLLSTRPEQTRYSCPSSDCDWPPFQTLGICSSCANLTDHVVTACRNVTVRWNSTYAYNGSYCDYSFAPELIPGAKLSFWGFWDLEGGPDGQAGEIVYVPLVDFNVSVILPDTQAAVDENPYTKLSPPPLGSLANISIIDWGDIISNVHINSLDMVQDMIPVIEMCNFTWCIQDYTSTSVQGGILYDMPSSTSSLYINRSYNMDLRLPPVNDVPQAESFLADFLPGDYSTVPCSQYESLADMQSANPNVSAWVYGSAANAPLPGEILTIAGLFDGFLQHALSAIISSVGMENTTAANIETLLSSLPDVVGEVLEYDNETWMPAMYTSAQSAGVLVDENAQFALQTLNNGNYSATLSNIAQGLTSVIGQGADSWSIQGRVMEPTVYIRISWPWLIYPGIPPLLTMLFLAIVIRQSNSRCQPIWKFSSLALAFHGVRWEDERQMSACSEKEIEDLAARLRTQLVRDEIGRISLRVT
jgi:hypothetical protein